MDDLKEYLSRALKGLYYERKKCVEDIEVAEVEGAIAELEILWDAFVGGEIPERKYKVEMN